MLLYNTSVTQRVSHVSAVCVLVLSMSAASMSVLCVDVNVRGSIPFWQEMFQDMTKAFNLVSLLHLIRTIDDMLVWKQKCPPKQKY